MVRATIELDDQVYERLRELASQRHVSVEYLVARAAAELGKSVQSPNPDERTLADFLDSVKDISFDLGDWKWNRDELYER